MELHGFLNIDKPLGWTSHDVVGRVRKIVGTRRVGHSGTLDPAATGVLVVGIGRATRFLDYVQGSSKGYVAHFVLGQTTSSSDVDGNLTTPSDKPDRIPDFEMIDAALADLTGEIDQIPPRHSAIKVDGEPLYRKARRGELVDVPVRRVRVYGIEIVRYSYPDLVVAIRCGPGVYIRSIGRDLGEALGCGAYVHHLLRDAVGGFRLTQSHSLHKLAGLSMPESWTSIATSIDIGVESGPAILVDKQAKNAWYHGRSIPIPNLPIQPSAPVRAVDLNGQFAGIGNVNSADANRSTVQPRVVLPA